MQEFPYQIVTFLGNEPQIGEPVYYGKNGWYPQLALKRRFKLETIDEEELKQAAKDIVDQSDDLTIKTGTLIKPDRKPVRVIDIINQDDLKALHLRLIRDLGNAISSRYPDREGDSYYAHITAEYNNEFVIPVDQYMQRDITLSNLWLLKDVDNENSLAYIKLK